MSGINSYGILDPDKIILNIQVKIPTIEDPTRSDIDTIDKTFALSPNSNYLAGIDQFIFLYD